MSRLHNSDLTGLSQTLRKNMTEEERQLWYCFLKLLPVTVNRQRIFGRYIADFFISATNTVIELDGSQHYEEESKRYDEERDEYMRQHGLQVLRYSNADIRLRFQSVCDDILKQTGIKVK